MRCITLLPAILLAGCAHAPEVPRYQPVKQITKPVSPAQTFKQRWLSQHFRHRAEQ